MELLVMISPQGTPAFKTPFGKSSPQLIKDSKATCRPFTTYCTTPSLNYHGFYIMDLVDPGLGLEVEIVFDYD